MSHPAERQNQLPARIQLGLGMAIFGSATPVSKIVTSALPVFVASTLRVALGALVLAPFAYRHRDQLRGLAARDWLNLCAIAVFGMFGFSALMLYGMRMTSGVAGAVVMSTAPAVTAAASMAFLGDKPTWRKIVAIVLAVVGVLILHLGQSGGGGGDRTSSGDETLIGSALVFAAVCCEAVYTLVGKKASERVDPVLAACLAALLSLPMFIPLAALQWPDATFGTIGAGVWIAVVWYGAGTLALGTWFWYAGVARAEGSVAAGFMGVMPVSALVLSYILLGEPFRWLHLLGFAIVLTGVLLISWEHARMSGSG